jgi:hypothetical protein
MSSQSGGAVGLDRSSFLFQLCANGGIFSANGRGETSLAPLEPFGIDALKPEVKMHWNKTVS